MPEELKAVDPEGCGCTDCITGHAAPVNLLNREEQLGLLGGSYRNRTSMTWNQLAERFVNEGEVTVGEAADAIVGFLLRTGHRPN